MIKKYRKIKKREVVDEHVVGSNLYCDACGKQICISQVNRSSRCPKYYTVFSGHNDWGNDSVDSYSNREICSNECLMKDLKRFLEETEGCTSEFYEISVEFWKEPNYIPDGDESED